MVDAQITILCIDDNPTNRYVVQRYLAESGFRVTEAASGAAGLAAIAQAPPDLVILDVHLPDISGFEICQQLKQNPVTASIPVLHLSAAYTRSADRAQGLESGADAYLVQPVEAVELIATIHALLRLYEAERTAHQQSREWQTTFDAMHDGVCLLDATGRVQRCNRAIAQLLNQSHAQLRDRHYLDLIPLPTEATEPPLTDMASPLREMSALRDRFSLRQLQTTGQRLRVEIPFPLTTGESGWLALTLDAIFDEAGTLTGAVYIATDMTLQKRVAVERERLLLREQEARTASETANRLKDEFLATLSHELRSPLNAILGWTNLLKTRPYEPGRAAQALEIIERNTRTQTQLIEDLLDVSRIIQGKLQLNIQPVNLGMLITTTLETIRPAAAAKSIQLHFQNDNTPGNSEQPSLKVLGDRDRLQQVIWNLLSNAVKFTPTGGQVEIRLAPAWVEEGGEGGGGGRGSRKGEEEQPDLVSQPSSNSVAPSDSSPTSPPSPPSHLQITITDTGKGITPAFLPHVFDRFRQADSSITRQYGGLGLGLSIVRHLIELHGGTVAAFSAGEGQGATFTVQLPILITPAAPFTAGSAIATTTMPSLLGFTVLVVDDEADSRSYLATLLELQEATVIAVSSTEEIPQILQQSTVHVLVSDIGMPDEDGYSLIRRIRALAPACLPPAIALTGYARSEDRERALAAGFQAYLTKPVEPDVLIAAIAALIAA